MFEGESIEGYDEDKYYRIWRRMENVEVLYDDFYNGSKEAIRKEAEFLERELMGARLSNKDVKKKVEQYDNVYRKRVAELEGAGNIEIEDFNFIYGKELHVAKWFANQDVKILLRNPEFHTAPADAEMWGCLWDFKRIESSNANKITTSIFSRIDNQQCNYIVDLSITNISKDKAYYKVAAALEDERLKVVLLVRSGKLLKIEK